MENGTIYDKYLQNYFVILIFLVIHENCLYFFCIFSKFVNEKLLRLSAYYIHSSSNRFYKGKQFSPKLRKIK